MASAVTQTNIADWLERNYQPPKLGNIAFKDAPLTAWLPHDENAGGEMVVLRWKYGNPQGVGATFTQASTRGQISGLKPAKVMFDYATWYSYCQVDNTAIERAMGGNLAATNILQESINGTMEAHGDHLETFMFSDGWQAIGTVVVLNPGSVANAITVDPSEIEQWEVDLEVVFAASRTTGILDGGGASLVVTKVDRDTNIIQFNANTSTISSGTALAQGHFAFIKSTRIDAATRQCLIGLNGYIPDVVSSTDSFGDGALNRSADPFRLAGARLTIPAGTSVQQGLIDFFVRCGKYKIKPDALWCSFERWGDLIKELGSQASYVNIKNEKYGVNITGVQLFTPKGMVPVIASAKCPFGRVWGLTRNSWKLYCVNGPLIKPAARYSKFLDDNTSDSIQLRYRTFAGLGCLRPWENATGIFA